ncbi:MAG: PKD domain-containing protein, partial [Bacteroidota bacterium]
VNVITNPTAGFTVSNNAQCLRGNSFSFSNASSGATAYSWSFGDGTTSTGSNPSKTYSSTGTFTVRLIARNAFGCTDTITRNITVHPQPVAAFSLNSTAQCLRGNSFTTTNSSSGATSYSWSFGDGTSSTASNPTKTYSAAGTYNIRLIAITGNSCRDTLTRSVTVNPNPTAAFSLSSSAQCLKANSFTTTNSSSGASSYSWTFGDGSSSTAANPTKTYSTAGTYTVRLVAFNSSGCSDTISRSVTVHPQPVAAFSLNSSAQCLRGNNFTTTNSSSGASNYSWSFGDGTTSTANNPTKTYSAAGTYNIRLIAVTGNSCRDTITRSVTVNPNPTASFTVSNNAQCFRGNRFVFNSTSTVSAGSLSYAWSFGGGRTSSNSRDSLAYADTGTYRVRLIAITAAGCRDTAFSNVVVYPQGTADFSIAAAAQCLRGNSFSFTDNSRVGSGSINAYDWRFGNGSTS